MKLRVKSLASYFTDPDRNAKWRTDDFRAWAIVKSYKDEYFKGEYSYNIGGRLHLIDYTNREKLVDLLNPVICKNIRNAVSIPFTLVPVPNSNAAVNGVRSFRTHDVAQRIAACDRENIVETPALRWRAVREKSHKRQGRRRIDHHLSDLVLVEPPNRPVVLYDDMCTSGSQLLACAKVLEDAGHEVLLGITVGVQAEYQVAKPLGVVEREIEQTPQLEIFD